MYEDLAMDHISQDPKTPKVDMIQIISEILHAYQPQFDKNTAIEWVNSEYLNFKSFDVYHPISCGLKKINPQIPENGINDIFQLIKKKFLSSEYEHQYFLYFIISKFIEIEQGKAERGQYLIQITRGNIPQTTGFFRRVNQMALYHTAKDNIKKC
jgi:hypothetical protein